MKNTNTILLDIGIETVKIVEISAQGDTDIIHKATSITGLKKYISEFGVENLSGLVDAIDFEIKSQKMKANKVTISTSTLGLKSTIKSVQMDRQEINPTLNPLQMKSSQLYGTAVKEDGKYACLIETVGSVYNLTSLAKELNKRGYSVLSIEDNMTATYNLMKLFEYDFDFPGKIILDLGNKIEYFIAKRDVPIYDAEYPQRLVDMLIEVSKNLEMDIDVIRNLFVNAGVSKSEEGEKYLLDLGIDAESYYESIRKFCYEYLITLRDALKIEAENFQLGRYYLIITGGFACVNGMKDLLSLVFNDEGIRLYIAEIEDKYESEYFKIINKSKTNFGTLYGSCIGLMLKNQYRGTVNLFPSKSIVKSYDKTIITAVNTLKIIVITLAIFLAGKTGYGVYEFIKLDAPRDNNTIKSELFMYEDKEKNLQQAVNNIKGIDKVGMDVAKKVMNYNNSRLSVVSIDSSNMFTAEDISSSGINTKKVVYVIRGYATTSAEISAFYSQLLLEDISPSLILKGVEKVNIGNKEVIYTFEIHAESIEKEVLPSNIEESIPPQTTENTGKGGTT